MPRQQPVADPIPMYKQPIQPVVQLPVKPVQKVYAFGSSFADEKKSPVQIQEPDYAKPKTNTMHRRNNLSIDTDEAPEVQLNDQPIEQQQVPTYGGFGGQQNEPFQASPLQQKQSTQILPQGKFVSKLNRVSQPSPKESPQQRDSLGLGGVFGGYAVQEPELKQYVSKLGQMKPRSTITQQVKEELDVPEAKPRSSIRNPFSGIGGFGKFGGGQQ